MADLNRQQRIETALSEHLDLQHLEVLNESGNHNVPDGAESHFKVVAVADAFAEQTRINRHRTINDLLQAEFDAGMHALAVHAFSSDEWRKRFGNAPMSPPCAHQ
ncbi:MAG: BolA/IbaG family iron-sulfur metabolism protein [Pseudomonadota bacterium]